MHEDPRSKLTFREFSVNAGFSSPHFLKLVIDGKRDLTPKSLPKVIQGLNLNEKQADHFINLVHFEQAIHHSERLRIIRKILSHAATRKEHQIESQQLQYYSKWYVVAIREMVELKKFRESPIWISKCLGKEVTPEQVRASIATLLKLNLLERSQDGQLKQTKRYLRPPDEVSNVFVTEFHKEMIRKGSNSIEEYSKDEREVSTVTCGVTPQGFDKIRALLKECRTEIGKIALAEKDQANKVVQVNFQLFPLADVKKGEHDEK